MIPTPDLSHLRASDYEHVYEPAEDTFILLDALEQDAQELCDLKPRIAFEVGSGSGCVSAFLSKITGPSAVLYLCTDINPRACVCTRATGAQNSVALEVATASLAAPFLDRLEHSVDVILFNPPYVPTYAEEALAAQADRDIGGSWAGGQHGMQVTETFFPQVDVGLFLASARCRSIEMMFQRLLSSSGRFYLVAVADNNIAAIQEEMSTRYGMHSQIVLQRRAGREHLFVVRFTRTSG
ncbi:unnamed protein product [Mycena citricolor]|uniref:Methyltransferase small domain-containing protein n=1 Tax=Mycena citricolor TaxID=2018698 RepID=A0AAD2HPV2_9AGAR|nr:unnamed protein product [Mycena citricolor]